MSRSEALKPNTDLSTLVREHVLYGAEIPTGTWVSVSNASEFMRGIASVVLQNPWLAKRYLEEINDSKNQSQSKSRVSKEKEDKKVYQRFVSLFNQFAIFCEIFYLQIETDKDKFYPPSNWLVQVDAGFLHSDPRPGRALRIGGLINRRVE